MASSIFRIDWIQVDTIIIILLFVLLISVKIFKSTHRWRQNYSNEDLEFYSYPTASKQFKGRILKTKKWNLTKNSQLLTNTRTTKPILLLGGYYKRKLIKVLTEGLASYGFSVINVKVKVKHGSSSNKLIGLIPKEFQSLIRIVLNFFHQESLIDNSGYSVIDSSRAQIPIKAYLPERVNSRIIIINPIICKKNFEEVVDVKSDLQNVFRIFSLKRFFFFKNKSLTNLFKNISKENLAHLKVAILDKSNRNFKYYETILLGLIIDNINNN